MLTNPAPLAALQLIRAICHGGTTPETALPHIVRLCDAALGPDADPLPQCEPEAMAVEDLSAAWPEDDL